MARTTALTWREYRRFLTAWVHRYAQAGHYWSIDGRRVLAINNLADFELRYGLLTLTVMLRFAIKVVHEECGTPPYLIGVIGEANPRNVRLANALPLDAITGYGLLPNWLGEPVQDYAQLISQRVADWEQVQRRIAIPFYPVVCAGWDATVRGAFRGVLRAEDGYPYSPVVTGVTPELFGTYLDCALEFNRRWQLRENIVFLHAWNEWTESSVIEPSDRFGNAFLDQIRARSGELRVHPLPDGSPCGERVSGG